MFDSKQILNLLARPGSHIVRETAGGRFAADTWVIKAADGEDLEADLGGFAYSPVRVPHVLLQDFVGARLVRPANAEAAAPVYRLTERHPADLAA
jgi:hypothetical protein